MEPILPSPFDADAFGCPFFRVTRIDETLSDRVRALVRDLPEVVIDAKTESGDVAGARLLWSLGFRKVCMQITLRMPLDGRASVPDGVVVAQRLDLQEDVLGRHAGNFRFDRFSLDPLLPAEGVRRLYARWIRNSLTSGAKRIVHAGDSFCTLSVHAQSSTIDLVSVLDSGRGIGRALVAGACRLAWDQGAREIAVTTECENARAWRLYVAAGFGLAKFVSVFHLVRRPGAGAVGDHVQRPALHLPEDPPHVDADDAD
jgi:GNAT superfamily N-acetyltransferase